MKVTDADLAVLSQQLELEREQLQLEREQFQKFVKPAMHCFARMLPELPMYVQQQHRTLQAEELAHLARAIGDLRVLDVGLDEMGALAHAKLRARLDYLVAKCARP